MPGSTKAIREPWRMAVSCLFYTYGDEFMDMDLPVLKTIDQKKIEVIVAMIKKKINSPMTSSLGRLFDGVASIAGIRQYISFEGQAAMELEMMAHDSEVEPYRFGITTADLPTIRTDSIISGIVDDIGKGVSPDQLSTRFHHTLVCLFTDVCDRLRGKTGIKTVAMSGGVFQNRCLLHGLIDSLERKGFKTITHKQVPCNDGGISLGQAVAAAAMVMDRKE
jgi:hydrogenase maturation protein HypF